MILEIPVTQRARKYGYLIWPKKLDSSIEKLIGEMNEIEVSLNGKPLGVKKIGWKYRRISLGPRQTNRLSEDAQTFLVQRERENKLIILCK